MNKYKVIEIRKNGVSNIFINNVLNPIFIKRKKDDVYFLNDNNNVKIFLNKLDFKKFNEDINNIIQENNLAKRNKNFLIKILDNINSIKSFGLKGNKRVYVGYNKERKVKNRKEKEINRKTNEKNDDFSKINNEIPTEFENKIICGDSLSVLKKLPDNCIDLIFTSPPYNFGLNYTSNRDDKNWDKYFQELFNVFKEGIRVLKFGGRFIVNIQPLFSDYIPSHHIISNFFIKNNLIWKGEILWEKNNYNCKYTSWGSWKSPSSPYLKYTWEFLEIFSKGTLKKEGLSENIDITADEFKKWVVAKWSIAPERRMKEFNHPAMFPEELVNRVLKLFSFRNDLILDPFNGVGTTTSIAKELGRRYLGIDISEEYCQKAEERI